MTRFQCLVVNDVGRARSVRSLPLCVCTLGPARSFLFSRGVRSAETGPLRPIPLNSSQVKLFFFDRLSDLTSLSPTVFFPRAKDFVTNFLWPIGVQRCTSFCNAPTLDGQRFPFRCPRPTLFGLPPRLWVEGETVPPVVSTALSRTPPRS